MASFLDSLRKATTKEAAKHDTKQAKAEIVFAPSNKKRPTVSQLRYLWRVFSRKERVFFLVLVALVLVGASVGVGRLYFSNTKAEPVVGGEYVEAMVGQPQYINPLLSSASDVDADLDRLIYSRLFTYNANRELVKDLVTEYAVSEDGKEYTLKLRNNVAFTDGAPLDADDVLFTIKAIQDPAYKSPLYASMKNVTTERVDNFTIKLMLSEPYAPFLSSLTFGILPEHLWFDIPPANVTLAETNLKPVGSGPYKFASLKKDKSGNIRSYTVVRNETFYSEAPKIEKVTFVIYADAASAVTAAAEKKVDGVSFVSSEERSTLEEQNGSLEMHNLRLPQYVAVFFNQNKNDSLKQYEVREALTRSFDKSYIVNVLMNGQAEGIASPILPGYLGYTSEVQTYDYDQEKARTVLENKKWEQNEEKGYRVQKDTNKELKFSLTTVDIPEYVSVANYLKEQWKQIGIEVEVKVISSEDIPTIIKERNYDALLFGNIVGTDPDPYPFWHSTQMKDPGLALAVFDNEKVDTLLQDARKATKQEDRIAKYAEFQKILADDLPAIFLYNPFYTYAVSKDVEGLDTMYVSAPADRFANITSWFMEESRVWVGDETGERPVDTTEESQPVEQPAAEQPAAEQPVAPETENTNTTPENTNTNTNTNQDASQ